jgi:hypothetical protein
LIFIQEVQLLALEKQVKQSILPFIKRNKFLYLNCIIINKIITWLANITKVCKKPIRTSDLARIQATGLPLL